MMQFEQRMPSLIDELCQLGVRFVHSGLREGLSTTALQRIDDAVRLTRDYTSPVFNLAFNYGFRAEVVNAVRNIIYDQVDPDTIDETVFGSYLWSHDLPDVDLVIRTGNDHRFSNYLLWQSAHANIYVVDKYWPELHESDVSTAFDCWSARTDAS
jgi:undecaprenyl diphosphate synthase